MKLSFSKLGEMLSAFDVVDADDVSSPKPGLMLIARNIRNFKRWSVIPISELNVFTGPNSSGKSTIIELIKIFSRGELRHIEAMSSGDLVVAGFTCEWSKFAVRGLSEPFMQTLFARQYISESSESLDGEVTDEYKERYRRFTWLMETWGQECWGIYIFGDQECLGQFLVQTEDPASSFALRVSPNLYRGRSVNGFEQLAENLLDFTPKFRKYVHRAPRDSLYYATKRFFPRSQPQYVALNSDNFDLDAGPLIAFDNSWDSVEDKKNLLTFLYSWFYAPLYIVGAGWRGIPIIAPVRSIPTERQLEFVGITEKHSFEKNWPEQDVYENVARALIKNKSKYLAEINEWLHKLLLTECSLGGDVSQIVDRIPKSPTPTIVGRRRVKKYAIKLYLSDGNAERIGFGDVGTGVSQVVPVVALLLSLNSNEAAILQQPELHLHPRAQSILADLLLATVARGHRITVETHSEHIILRVIRRLAERHSSDYKGPSISPSQLRLVYFDPSDSGSEPHWIRVDESGRFLDPWPSGFFEERYDDIFFDRLQ